MVIAVRPEAPPPPPRKLDGEEELLLTGSEAIAQALQLADVDIVAAYPIRPYDAVMQAVATMIADGKMDCEYIVAEGEHSQFELVKHASAVGARSVVGYSGVVCVYAFQSSALCAALRRAPEVIREAYREYYELTGRQKEPFVEEYMTDDADYVLVGQGTIAMPCRVIVRRLREQGHKVGFARLKWFRPFPAEEVVERLGRFKGVGIIDRDYSYGSPHHGGVLFTEFRAAFYDSPKRPALTTSL